jgi:hypothetical protein|uniref:Zinc finger HIT domain-containing protein 3 n=1 Tax=Picea sitchensis TaxID=3332 RepID=A9NPU9_PICSI|nr:unknown [Picea sitchensis]
MGKGEGECESLKQQDRKNLMGGRQCQVCGDAPSKYKCPTCFIPYCSLMCFKQHKEVPCSREAPAVSTDSQPTQPPRSFEEEDEQGWRLHRTQLEAVVASSEIRNILKDQELQKIILRIDSSENAEEELDKAMEGPHFQEFTDKILSIISPEEQSHITQA